MCCRVAVGSRSKEHNSPSSLYLGHHLSITEAEQRRYTKALQSERQKFSFVNISQAFSSNNKKGSRMNENETFLANLCWANNNETRHKMLTWNDAVNAEITKRKA